MVSSQLFIIVLNNICNATFRHLTLGGRKQWASSIELKWNVLFQKRKKLHFSYDKKDKRGGRETIPIKMDIGRGLRPLRRPGFAFGKNGGTYVDGDARRKWPGVELPAPTLDISYSPPTIPSLKAKGSGSMIFTTTHLSFWQKWRNMPIVTHGGNGPRWNYQPSR